MGYSPEDYEKTWVELPPEPNQTGRNWVKIGAIIAGVALTFCVCGAAAYFGVQQFRGRTTIPERPVVQIPTPISDGTAVAGGEIAEEPTPANALPATVTIPSSVNQTPSAPPIVADANVEIPRFASPPTLDGNLGEWEGVPSVQSLHQVYAIADWDGSDDLTAVWQLGWDDDYLFVAVTIQDDRHVQNQWGETMYKGDSVEMQLDVDRAGDYAPNLSPDDYQFIFSPGDFDRIIPSAIRFRGTAAGRIPVAPGHLTEVAAEKTGNGYTLEAFIPWSDLAVTPQADMTIGASLNANDNDRIGQAIQEVMKSHVSTRLFADPTSWGSVTLR